MAMEGNFVGFLITVRTKFQTICVSFKPLNIFPKKNQPFACLINAFN
jgi:hypothetical protein